VRIKSPPCCLLHHDPAMGCGVCVSFDVPSAWKAPSTSHFELHFSTFFSGSPANRTQRDPVISRIQATSLRLPILSGTSESNREPPAPKAGVLPSAPLPDLKSERQDLNLRSLGPQPSAITRLRHVLIVCAHRERKWAGRCSNPRLRLFRPPLNRLSYQPVNLSCFLREEVPRRRFCHQRNKKTRCLATPGLRWESPQGVTGVTSVTDARADYSPIDRRCRPCTDVRICLGSLNASLFWSSHWGDESVARSFTDWLDGGACPKVRKKFDCSPLLLDALARGIISFGCQIFVRFSSVHVCRPNSPRPGE
jgi:hypothetical protein